MLSTALALIGLASASDGMGVSCLLTLVLTRLKSATCAPPPHEVHSYDLNQVTWSFSKLWFGRMEVFKGNLQIQDVNHIEKKENYDLSRQLVSLPSDKGSRRRGWRGGLAVTCKDQGMIPRNPHKGAAHCNSGSETEAGDPESKPAMKTSHIGELWI